MEGLWNFFSSLNSNVKETLKEVEDDLALLRAVGKSPELEKQLVEEIAMLKEKLKVKQT